MELLNYMRVTGVGKGARIMIWNILAQNESAWNLENFPNRPPETVDVLIQTGPFFRYGDFEISVDSVQTCLRDPASGTPGSLFKAYMEVNIHIFSISSFILFIYYFIFSF